MAKLTLLDMVQDILNDLDSDPVNAITDTEEAEQVAQIIKTTYFSLIGDRDWPFLRTLTAFTGLGDTSNPTKMQMPELMSKVFWVRYNKLPITYMTPAEFKDMIDQREEQADVVDANGYVINRDPLYWTTYDDNYVYFDAYDSDTESTLQQSKSAVYGQVTPSWTHTGAAIPTLPEKMFPTLLADAKSTAFLVLKQQANAKEESKARRGKFKFQKEAFRANAAETKTNQSTDYGRK